MAGQPGRRLGPALALVHPPGRRGEQPPHANPRAGRRRGPHGHQHRWRAGPQHARPRPPPRRGSRRAVPPRPQQGTAPRSCPRRRARRGRLPGRPRSALDRAGCHAAHRLRAVLENHPGIAALLKTRDPLSPASLALAEAFLAPLHAAGLPGRQAALAFRLIYDYTLGFALADPTSPAEQRLRDSAARQQLHAFLRSLPASSFPALAAYGAYAWADDRDQRFTSGLDTLIRGLQAAQRSPESSHAS